MPIRKIEELIVGCKQNNRICQEELYKQVYPYYYTLCKNYLSDKHDALTALNDGMLNIFKNIDKYDSALGDFLAWGYTVVRYATLTYIKNKMHQKPFAEYDERFANEVIVSTHDDQILDDVCIIIQRLPPATRTVCQLFYFDAYTIKEISNNLNINEGTVKWHLCEGRNKIRKTLETNRKNDR